MSDVILALNAGSSSIKFSLFVAANGTGALSLIEQGEVAGIGSEPRFLVHDTTGQSLINEQQAATLSHEEALGILLKWIAGHKDGLKLIAVGHRVVHGGTLFAAPVRVDAEVLKQLEQLVPLAPLHQPHNLAAIRALAESNPTLPQVACFDTAFHCTQSRVAQAFALPRDVTDRGVRRYGFHGLSYEYIASVLPYAMGSAAEGRIVVAHLGAGASMCAMRNRASIATSMGFTALDGLPMGTRCGAIDPGVILYLMEELHMDVSAVTDLLYHRSGMLGVSGLSSDMKELLASDSPRATEAIDLFVYRIGRELGSLAATLGGLDALVFTAGIGEHAVPIRARVCQDAQWLGVRLDAEANQAGESKISTEESTVSVWVIPTNEDLMIAHHTRDVVRTPSA